MKDKAQKTRQLIINEATQLFTKNGYYKTSLSQILQATGLAKGGFYFHFNSKEELGMAVLDDLQACWTEEVLPSMMRGGNAKQKLEIMFSTPGDCAYEQGRRPTILLLNLATEMSEVHDPFSRKLQEIFQGWQLTIEAILEEGKLERLFRKDVDSEALAAIILSNILGANLLALLDRNSDRYLQQLRTLGSVLFEGIGLSQARSPITRKEEK